jgi:hypothetical protein
MQSLETLISELGRVLSLLAEPTPIWLSLLFFGIVWAFVMRNA